MLAAETRSTPTDSSLTGNVGGNRLANRRRGSSLGIMTNRGSSSVVLILALLAGPQGALAGWLDPRFDLPGANGAIHSLIEFRGALYAVGGFTRISGVDAPGMARWTGSKWEAI